MTAVRKLLEPDNTEELLRGWFLHAHKSRTRHDEAARRYETWRYRLGIPAMVLSAVVGSSVLASLGTSVGTLGGITVGLLGIGAAVFGGLQTFLDYPGRAERHRSVAVKYKAIIRELEQALTGALDREDPRGQWITDLRARIDALEENMPIVAQRIFDHVDALYGEVMFIGKVLEPRPGDRLTPPMPPTGSARG